MTLMLGHHNVFSNCDTYRAKHQCLCHRKVQNRDNVTGLNNSKKNQVAHRATCWWKSGCPYQESGCPFLPSPIVNNKAYDGFMTHSKIKQNIGIMGGWGVAPPSLATLIPDKQVELLYIIRLFEGREQIPYHALIRQKSAIYIRNKTVSYHVLVPQFIIRLWQ